MKAILLFFILLQALVRILILKMENPTKAEIAQVFKRLSSIPANKVSEKNIFSNFEYFRPRHLSLYFSFVLIVVAKIQHGLARPMECSFALIAPEFIAVLESILHLSNRPSWIIIGHGSKFEICNWEAMLMR